MTRFEQELSGSLGEFWQREAQIELQRVRNDLEAGRITIDGHGVAFNCIGRVLMSDEAQKVSMVTERINLAATQTARDKEVAESVREYRANRRAYSAEEIAEMRAAFGSGETVVDILTGQSISL